MKICQIAPLVESVPPRGYGGTERVVHWITEELVRRGHDVTLYASSDSLTSARLASTHTKALRTNPACREYISHHMVMLEQVVRSADQFDIIHSHVDYLFFPWIRHFKLPCISTIHNSIETENLGHIYNEFRELPLVAISQEHKRVFAHLNWTATIYHGMPRHLYFPNYSPNNYLLFLGRFSEEKRPDLAIKIALNAGHKIKLAAKLDPNPRDQNYFNTVLKPLLDLPGVEYLGEVSQNQKRELLANAKAMLFPIEWPEPFGLVMIEAMASGTPVIAFRRGSVPEIIEHGQTGFICDNVDEAVAGVDRIEEIDRRTCRAEFERRFSVETMVDAYLKLYARMTSRIRAA